MCVSISKLNLNVHGSVRAKERQDNLEEEINREITYYNILVIETAW